LAAYIKIEITSNQPGTVMRKTKDQVLLTHLLPDILERRLIKLNGVCDAFPIFIKKVINRLSQISGRTSEAELKTLTVAVCTVFGSMSIHTLYSTVRPTDQQIAAHHKSSGDEDALAVAIGMKDRDLIQGLLAAGVSPISKTSMFGNMLNFAAEHAGTNTFHFFLNTIPAAITHRERTGRKTTTAYRIEAQLEANNEDIALDLLDYFLATHAPTTARNAEKWMKKAVAAGADRLTVRLASHSSAADLAEALCRGVLGREKYPAGSDAVMRTLLEQGVINTKTVNTTIVGWPCILDLRQGNVTQCLLDLAVRLQDTDLVKQLFDLGAPLDGGIVKNSSMEAPKSSFPLRVLIHRASVDISNVLLGRCADPCFGLSAKEALEEVEKELDRVVSKASDVFKAVIWKKYVAGKIKEIEYLPW
jgi:hypothetical protein